MASELVAEAVAAMEFSASSEDIARIVHAHPSCRKWCTKPALAFDKTRPARLMIFSEARPASPARLTPQP